MAKILNGKKISQQILAELKKEVPKLEPLKLAVVLVGNNSKSLKYIHQKQKAAQKIGVGFEVYKFNTNISNRDLITEINKVVNDNQNTGIIVQLPLPEHVHTQKILNLIPNHKDVDGLSVDNPFLESPAASGIIELLRRYNIELESKKIVIVGKGRLVGKPLIKLIKQAGLDFIACDINTKNISKYTLNADILISATGHPKLITPEMVKPGVIVIDAGVGDIDFENLKSKASYITPPIGGVGPMTVAMLMSNLIKLAKLS